MRNHFIHIFKVLYLAIWMVPLWGQ
ncbi:uncharacterized protein METZ01_LOCUS258863 [marine metagenome]|uniref:Uncharacterized protein n=1 Tax=marine metagenome TaxID=408172 RepID=A0A382J312_9ZZZZ